MTSYRYKLRHEVYQCIYLIYLSNNITLKHPKLQQWSSDFKIQTIYFQIITIVSGPEKGVISNRQITNLGYGLIGDLPSRVVQILGVANLVTLLLALPFLSKKVKTISGYRWELLKIHKNGFYSFLFGGGQVAKKGGQVVWGFQKVPKRL